MAEIAWWAWLGVGLFVAVSSALTGGKVSLFAWVGLLFIVIGIGKVVYLFVMRPKETSKEQNLVHPQHMPRAAPQASYCPRCRITVQPGDYFCRYCGTRLR